MCCGRRCQQGPSVMIDEAACMQAPDRVSMPLSWPCQERPAAADMPMQWLVHCFIDTLCMPQCGRCSGTL